MDSSKKYAAGFSKAEPQPSYYKNALMAVGYAVGSTIVPSGPQLSPLLLRHGEWEFGLDFRFGSKADVTLLNFDVRFTPRKQTLRSATRMSAKCHSAARKLLDYLR